MNFKYPFVSFNMGTISFCVPVSLICFCRRTYSFQQQATSNIPKHTVFFLYGLDRWFYRLTVKFEALQLAVGCEPRLSFEERTLTYNGLL